MHRRSFLQQLLKVVDLTHEGLATAKAMLPLVRVDSSSGYESTNQYFYIPQDIREKILSCRLAADRSRKGEEQ